MHKLIHVEAGHIDADASTVIEQYNDIVESAVKGAVEGLKIGMGLP